MAEYTREQLERADGLSSRRPMLAVSYDGGETWNTMDLSDSPGGDPTDVLTVPAGGTLADGA